MLLWMILYYISWSIFVDLYLIKRPFTSGNDGTSRAPKHLKDIVSQQ